MSHRALTQRAVVIRVRIEVARRWGNWHRTPSDSDVDTQILVMSRPAAPLLATSPARFCQSGVPSLRVPTRPFFLSSTWLGIGLRVGVRVGVGVGVRVRVRVRVRA